MSALAPDRGTLSAEDLLRAHLYGFLSRLLGTSPDEETLGVIRGLGRDETPLGVALGELAEAAAGLDEARAEAEYTSLFIGLTQGEVIPFGSYYKTGFLYEKPLSELRDDMRALGIAADQRFAEPEDHLATLFEVMNGLILGRFGPPADLASQKRFFDAHIAPWAPKFFQDLEAAESAVLYRPIARVGSLFVAIESEAFAMA